MKQQANIAEAKNNLPKYIHKVESGTDICITRHGKAVAMLVSMENYHNQSATKGGLFNAIMQWRQQLDTIESDIVSDDFIDGLRDKKQARNFSWD